ncbi:MAG: SGNH/GDSL hydrolase family protein [Bacteroidota bacterium]|jgi:lysophospholipase L1-like esterase
MTPDPDNNGIGEENVEPSNEFDTTKDRYTIVVFGDSISRGVIYDGEKKSHTLLLESFTNLVKERLKGIVYNAAKFGNTISDAVQRLQNDVLRRKPDIVLIEFGGNDCDFQWDAIARDPTGTYHPNTDCSTFTETLLDLVNKLQVMKIVPVLVTLPPLDPERYFTWVSHNAADAKENIGRWLGSVSRIYSWHERYNAAILSVAEKTKTRLIDIRSAFLQTDDYTSLMCEDGIHPNKKGHQLIAQKILNYIETDYTFLLTTNPQISAR